MSPTRCRIVSWPSLKTDLQNAGALWMDQEVVVDGKLVSSRKPDDIPAFNREMLKLFSQRPAGRVAQMRRLTRAMDRRLYGSATR